MIQFSSCYKVRSLSQSFHPFISLAIYPKAPGSRRVLLMSGEASKSGEPNTDFPFCYAASIVLEHLDLKRMLGDMHISWNLSIRKLMHESWSIVHLFCDKYASVLLPVQMLGFFQKWFESARGLQLLVSNNMTTPIGCRVLLIFYTVLVSTKKY